MQEIFDKAMVLMDNYTEDGVRVPVEDTIDLQAKSIPLADMAQKELYSISRIEKSFEFNNKPAPNLLGNLTNFDQVDFIGIDQVYPKDGYGVIGAKAYYFEATGVGQCVIEEYNGVTYQTLLTVNMPLGSSYAAYKGVIAPSNINYPIRMRFTGTTFFRHVNRCLFSYPFAVSQIPDYRPWILIDLPPDFMDISQLVSEYPERQYGTDIPYKWEMPNKLYVNYFFDANYRMIYKPIPPTITQITDTLECNAIIGQLIPYYVAAKLSPFENQNLVNFYEGKYNEMKLQAQSPTPLTWEKVATRYDINLRW